MNDEAVFPSTLTAAIFVEIPADTTVTVGAIAVYRTSYITIREKINNSGRLVLRTSTGAPHSS